MPKIIELTVEIDIERVSCPGVWLCQDGRVSLTIFALGTSYQTCLLPPLFPLMFKDIFYFRKRFQETCALNNICCLLKEETIYCELVQWCDDCGVTDCKVLAQYLGALNDVLFPPNMCSNDGVDLLMRRSKDFPGILSPKIEITTKVRIDEIWDQAAKINNIKAIPCSCIPRELEATRQKQVCHSAQYHRSKCYSGRRDPCVTRSLSRSRSCSRSCCSFTQAPDPCACPNPLPRAPRCRSPRRSPKNRCGRSRSRQFCVYNVQTENAWRSAASTPFPSETSDLDDELIRFK
ncbi:spermatogenesis-associated protein 6 isoform X5 [Plodia interpunctella]|uniref:spermatogenesis-associated protein 6 isoform X3 n=1 Tax=Plodia interpunctella TaxID=58824 RepID=UPI002368B81F|nr:spermatogenesis-associated protein 6 isoform X3 [Plodia interpunctella]XP_053602456.1 spermatogenesis-associated protein 6 isoform X5 [Plodia interpunctella]